ncbi:hypothetical protein [Rhodococcoides kyotonense]|uniref:Uncharacterized protein n=1 Tax=Rhodococcoides kyotonense TaxID=398843 RepID=A0A239FPV2_9NOCA|nr:hypothetical protein [Rhodococcus kyotonensis]SNS58859.1 hypothetical protein SAMN05421642_103400 [Rhodococcus kyotonensis]
MTTTTVDEAAFLACEMAVLRALEMAGKRCRGVSRERRKQLISQVPDYLLYMQLHYSDISADADRILDGAWAHLRLVLPGRTDLYQACDRYVRDLLARRTPHTKAALAAVLETSL